MRSWAQSLSWEIDLVVPMPLGRKRFRERSYNQAEMISRPLSLAMNWKHSSSALTRSRETRTQIGLSASERRDNVHGAFTADARQVAGKNILIIDDVATTGSTLSAGADALLASGARHVYTLTVARALPHHSLSDA
jgi:ComF family protein